jgi:sugar lactone lactonase YvrE
MMRRHTQCLCVAVTLLCCFSACSGHMSSPNKPRSAVALLLSGQLTGLRLTPWRAADTRVSPYLGEMPNHGVPAEGRDGRLQVVADNSGVDVSAHGLSAIGASRSALAGLTVQSSHLDADDLLHGPYLEKRQELSSTTSVSVAVMRKERGYDSRTPSPSINAPVLSPEEPNSIAVTADGRLYIADWGRQQILERLPDGQFKVVAGTGVPGYSGDGGSALRARVDYPNAMTIGPDGALYFVQRSTSSTSVVRKIAPNGRITSVVGAHPNCNAPGATSTSIPANDAAFYGGALTFGPGHHLYISAVVCSNTSRRLGPLLQLSPTGNLIGTRWDNVLSKQGACFGSGLAFGRDGSVYVACDSSRSHPKEVVAVHPDGSTMVYPGVYPYDDYSGLASAPNDTVVAQDWLKVVRLSRTSLQTIINFGPRSGPRYLGPKQTMEPNGVAVDARNNVYLASTSGFGNGSFTGIVEVHPSGRIQVLWRRGPGPSR